MAEDWVLALGMVAAVYGVAELLIHIAFRLLFGGKKHSGCHIVCAPSDDREVEFVVRKLSAMQRLLPVRSKAVLLVNKPASTWLHTLCRELGVECCSPREMTEMLSGGLQENENAI